MKTKLLATLLVLNTSLNIVMAQSQLSTPTREECFETQDTTITNYLCNETAVVIPEIIRGQQVLSIGNFAFFENQLTSVVIPNSVTIIGDNAFVYNELTSVVIPNNVISIEEGAFSKNQLIGFI